MTVDNIARTSVAVADRFDDGDTAEIARAADELARRILSAPDALEDALRTGFSASAWAAIKDAGWFDLHLAESAGGMGLGLSTVAAVMRVAGQHLIPGPLLEHLAIVPTVVASTNDDAVRTMLLGADVVALADQAAVGGRHAQPQEPLLIDNRGYLSGVCPLVRHAMRADLLIVLVDGDTPAIAVVDPCAPGVDVTPVASLDNQAQHSTVTFSEVRDFTVLTENASHLIEQCRAISRLLTGCHSAGAARHLVNASVTYAQERRQFGRAIGSFQAIQHILADMHAHTLAAEALCADTAPLADHARLARHATVVKAIASGVARTVGENALQVHGGVGFTAEHHVHRWFLRILTDEGRYGDHTDMASDIGRQLLAQPWDELWS